MWVRSRIFFCDSVVSIPILLAPWIKDDFGPRFVGKQRGNNALIGVVEVHWTYAVADVKLETMRQSKKRFVFSDGFAFVIENRPSCCHPTITLNFVSRVGASVFILNKDGFCLEFLLDCASESINVREAREDARFVTGSEIDKMSLSSK